MFGDQHFPLLANKTLFRLKENCWDCLKLCHANFMNKAHMHKCSALFQYPDSSPTINQHKALGSNFRLTGFQSRMNFNYNFKAADELQLHSITVSKILYQPNTTTAQGNIL